MPLPQTGDDDSEAHDILAAEAFAMPATDPTLHHGPVQLPSDPAGDVEPHDILAAEEFAMPAVRPWETGLVQPRGSSPLIPIAALLGAVLLLLKLVLGRRRRSAD